MVKLGGNTGRLNSSRLYSVWIKHGHFADAKPCGKSMDKSRRLDIVHRFATLDHPLTTLRQGKIMRKSLTKNSTMKLPPILGQQLKTISCVVFM